MNRKRSGWLVAAYLTASWVAGNGVCALAGCEQKEKVIEVKTLGTDTKVEHDKNTG